MEKEKKKLPTGTIIGVLIKSSKLVKFVKLIKLAKYAKYLITLITMLISALVYGWRFGIWFGVGLVLLLFVHEMGHVWAMKQKGYPTKAPIFIPLLGAVIFSPPFKSREDESYIGFMGPLIGSIGALALYGVWALLPSKPEILVLLVYIGLWINLFNLIPIRPLDGGRVLQSTGTWYKWIGLSMVIAIIVIMQAPQFIVILILSVDDFVKKIKERVMIRMGLICTIVLAYILGPGINIEFWIDMFLAFMLISVDLIIYWPKRNDQKIEPEKDIRPFPDKHIKIAWLTAFFALAALLMGIMVYLLPQMPKMKW